jgi:hypothetical protein
MIIASLLTDVKIKPRYICLHICALQFRTEDKLDKQVNILHVILQKYFIHQFSENQYTEQKY